MLWFSSGNAPSWGPENGRVAPWELNGEKLLALSGRADSMWAIVALVLPWFYTCKYSVFATPPEPEWCKE